MIIDKPKKKLSNDQVLLDTLLNQQKQQRDPDASISDFFEYFSADQILKEYDLSDEELQFGIVGGEHDGGIDALYTLVNGKLVRDPDSHPYPKHKVEIRVVVIQAKTESGFGEDALNSLIASTGDLFDSQNDLSELKPTYNPKVLDAIDVFRGVFVNTATLFPEAIHFDFYYVARASSKRDVHPNTARKTSQLGKTINQLFPKSNFLFQFVGARELYEIASKSSVQIVTLKPNEAIPTPEGSYICLINLVDYFYFITFIDSATGKRELLGGILDSNVRDYEGDVEVNQSIQATLATLKSEEDFWWLNNGVTALVSDISASGKMFTVKGLQVVNGLQTSIEIFNYFSELSKSKKTIKDPRNILVRFIKCSDTASRDRIIKATNNQTKVPSASLRATDPLQEKIEDYLYSKGWFYERRKNYYKNQGAKKKKIISITYLAQAVVSIALQEPNNAKGRPSTLLNDEVDYRRIFNPDYPWELYLECIKFMKQVEEFIKDFIPLTAILNMKIY